MLEVAIDDLLAVANSKQFALLRGKSMRTCNALQQGKFF